MTTQPSATETPSGSRLALLKRLLELIVKDERTVMESVNVFASRGAKIVPFDLAVKLQRLRQQIACVKIEIGRYGET